MHDPRSAIGDLVKTVTTVACLWSLLAGAIHAQSGPEAPADPDAMRKIAATLPKLDIAGVRLGMSPEEAVAAIKAANPAFKIDVFHTRLQRPGRPTFDRLPRWIVGHTVNPAGRWERYAVGGESEFIEVEFTTPPARPVVAKIERQVLFPPKEPVLAAVLVDALQKKYGADPLVLPGDLRAWPFDASGKPISQPFSGAAGSCYGDPEAEMGATWNSDPAHDEGSLDIDTQANGTVQPACANYTIVVASSLGESATPQTTKAKLVVSLQSGALQVASWKLTHDWLQQQADSIAKQKEDAASKRKAPKM